MIEEIKSGKMKQTIYTTYSYTLSALITGLHPSLKGKLEKTMTIKRKTVTIREGI